MRKILMLLLLTGATPLPITAQTNYDHKVIAVLPCRTKFTEYKNISDSNMQAFRTLEVKYGIQLQEALYNTITADTNRLLVEVQPWQTTDSILRNAGLDLRKVPFLDISAIAKRLKVDACIVTTATYGGGNVGNMRGSTSMAGLIADAAASQLNKAIYRNNKIFTFRLIDGKSGDEVWNYSQEMTVGDITLVKDQLVFSKRIFKRFRKQFPYCD
ncbi:hypothetical protein AB6805_15740 [Chitinophaga sp. RCC_12]|uniref:hypothetical protein n=1 Tax=Chitinophaga sp. RCC_12 TaxID=3239226 RepID=UPI003525C6CE